VGVEKTMNLETLFRVLYLSWCGAEILIAVVTRTRRGSGLLQDRGSQFVVWTLGIVALRSADWIRHIAPWNISVDTRWSIPPSLVVLIAGIAIRAACIITLGRAFSANVGIRQAQRFTRDGLYRYVRHPSYLGIEVALFAVALNSGNWACFAWILLLPTVGLLDRIQVEEKPLRTTFGEDYAAYCRTTKRLIPGLFLFVICASTLLSRTVAAQDHVGNALGGKAKLEVLHRYEGPEILPKPTRVLIRDFAYTVPTVMGEAASSHRHHGSEAAPIPDELVQQLRDSFAKTAIGQFKKMNFETDRVSDASAVLGPALVVEGEFSSIVPGSSRKRILVGFGRGASDLKTHVVISELVDGQKTILLDCNIDSKSGKKPGAILSTSGTGFAIGVATGHFGDKVSSTVKADASRMAKLIGKQTKTIMVAQQWIAKPSKK
jgi:protein-S-isoprenylcysteine O-methyltransferase Ste14